MLDIQKITSKEQSQAVYVTKGNADEFTKTLKHPGQNWIDKIEQENCYIYRYKECDFFCYLNCWYVCELYDWVPIDDQVFNKIYAFVDDKQKTTEYILTEVSLVDAWYKCAKCGYNHYSVCAEPRLNFCAGCGRRIER